MRAPVLLLLLAGCSMNEERYNVVVLPALCAAQAECAGTFTEAACVDAARTEDRSACTFDPKSARECDGAIDDAVCEDVPYFGGERLALPEACSLVWDCPEPG